MTKTSNAIPRHLEPYPPIADYGFIADCHSAALVGRSGSIDWCCMPRVDSSSCFGRLLGWEEGGYYMIAPDEPFQVERRYLDGTLILETVFRTSGGATRVLDCFTMTAGGAKTPHRQLLRMIEGIEGDVPLRVELVPRFNYGGIKPWIRELDGYHAAIGGNDGLCISGDLSFDIRQRHDLVSRRTVHKGERIRVSILWRKPEEFDAAPLQVPTREELDARFQETVEWWQSWAARCTYDGPFADYVRRSAIVLKGLTNAPTGAIAAAPTTSLPEAPGGSRNWDYRFSWIRDSCFTVLALGELGYSKEADGFRKFVERSAAGSAEQLQIFFGVGGERQLPELEIGNLEGYRGARPVRIGNAAKDQLQLDVLGELLELAWRWHKLGNSPDEDYWEFLVDLVNHTARQWHLPDRGIWEMRGEPRHFVQSKAMCWAALDRGIALAEEIGRQAPLNDWRRVREEIRQAIEQRGYDAKRGVFIQAFDYPVMDAALLLLPSVGFVAYDDERMVRTAKMIQNDLSRNGLIARYPDGNDGMDGEEGVFLACSFWLAECLAHQGRLDEAEKLLKKLFSTGNDLFLFSEEFDPRTGEMLGNFPQGLTHLSLITSVVAFR
jgi:GH15 family glucan-1,4-alpha-glucosidase